MKRHRMLIVIGTAVLLLTVTLLPNSAYAVTSSGPPVAQPQVSFDGSYTGVFIIMFSIIGILAIGLGFFIWWLVRRLSKK